MEDLRQVSSLSRRILIPSICQVILQLLHFILMHRQFPKMRLDGVFRHRYDIEAARSIGIVHDVLLLNTWGPEITCDSDSPLTYIIIIIPVTVILLL